MSPGRTGAERRRSKLACVSLLSASGLCGESRTAAGAPQACQRLQPGRSSGTRPGAKRRRSKLACVSLLSASGLCGESRTAAGAPQACQRLQPGRSSGRRPGAEHPIYYYIKKWKKRGRIKHITLFYHGSSAGRTCCAIRHVRFRTGTDNISFMTNC